jgi:threonylcarbamoyladenosine tRNA methylthiotransferase MtaB
MGFGFHIQNFGCRAARADGEAIGARLLASGNCIEQPSEADVVVVNTCSVTAEADREARAFIRRANRLNPAARIVVTGCYAQRAPAELAAISGVAAVVGNSHKALVPEIVIDLAHRPRPQASAKDSFVSVESLLGGPASIFADDSFAHSFIEEAQLAPGERTRPNLKIQEGCGNRCTFCVIPFTRGSSKSLPHAVVLRQVEGFINAGGNELVLSGINLGQWGRELPEKDSLPALVRHILTRTALPRLRLSSIEPMDWTGEFIGLMAEFAGSDANEPRLARHAHLPLQSGSDAVLRRMHRRYRPWHYADKVAALVRAAGPELTLGADVMVGFPGETDAEFEETVAFIRALPFGYLHLFPFSPRPGTRGWELHAAAPVASQAVLERMSTLRALARDKSVAHRAQMIGRELPVITLHTPAALGRRGRTEALTDNFLPVELEGYYAANQLLCIEVRGLTPEGALTARPAGLVKSAPDLTEACALNFR